MFIVQLMAGAALLAIASYVFWRLGDDKAISPRLRDSIGFEALVVLVVLGGWSGGASCIVLAIASLVGA